MRFDRFVEPATGSVDLMRLLMDAASARAARAAARCVEIAEDDDGMGGAGLEHALWRLRSMRLAAELAAGATRGDGSLAGILERLLSAHLMSSSGISLLRTRIGILPSKELRGLDALVVAATCEMVHVAECVARGGDGAEVIFGADVDDGWLMLTVKAGVEDCDVLPADGAAALGRLRAMAATVGGIARRRCGAGGMGIAFTFGLDAARVALGVAGCPAK